ncbi:MAG: hypothetical protein ACI378_10230 [Bacteroides sp.]
MTGYRSKRLQGKVTTGRWTLPLAVLIALTGWLLMVLLLPDKAFTGGRTGYPLWQHYVGSRLSAPWGLLLNLLLCGGIGCLLIGVNNSFALIRMRASVQTALYYLLMAACPTLYMPGAGGVAALLMWPSLYFLFRSYQSAHPPVHLFHSFLCLGIGSLAFPQLTWLAPLFWIGASLFRSFSGRSFFASLLGWSIPYWFLLGHAFWHGDMALFCQPFHELVTFTPIRWMTEPWQWATVGYLALFYLIGAGHCLLMSHDDKLRTRSFLRFLTWLGGILLLYVCLQPDKGMEMLSSLTAVTALLGGHYLVLTGGRWSNIVFILLMAGWLLLYLWNLWTLL